MSLLAPLYALGVLAIGLPLLFHLIQRRPRGQIPFSSLMFLTASPPRIAKRSKLDNILLLLLRALALILLAVAFARPFLRSLADLQLDTPSRRLVLLIDTSASMRRDDLWQQAQEQAQRVLDDLRPTDRVALVAFDSTPRTLVGFDDSAGIDAARRGQSLRAAVRGAAPGWAATDLGSALVAAAELLQTAAEGRDETGSLPPQIVLISDLQGGADLDQLSGYDWPADIRVDVRALRASKPTNAAALLLADLEPALDSQQTALAVRVSNAADSSRDQFRLGWADAQGRLLGNREYPVTVPAGESRVVQVEPSPASSRLLLIGDDQPFDNTLYVAGQTPRQRKLIYVGAEAEDPRGLLYFLRAASLDTPWQQVTVEAVPVEAPLPPLDPAQVPLVVLGAPVSDGTGGQLRQQYVQRGGQVLVVLTRQAHVGADEGVPADTGASADVQAPTDSSDNSRLAGLRRLLDLPGLRVEEAPQRDYAMLERIDFRHPLFQPLADPRFSDFTKIRFWNYRRLSADEEVTWNVLATFDDGSPALVEQPFGKGRCWVLAAGWHPDESQLALSTKFVPLLAGLVDPLGGRPPLAANYRVGQPIPLPEGQAVVPIEMPDGSREELRGGTAFRQTNEPGIYRIGQGDQAQTVAINIDSAESRTWPRDPAELEQRGLLTGKARTMAEIQAQQRQLRDVELEGRQKWWRWLIFAALGILIAETCLAGWLARGKPKSQG